MNWFCYLGSHAVEHAVEPSRDLLQDLLLIPGELLSDAYDDRDETDES
jgi:hypothetical protein